MTLAAVEAPSPTITSINLPHAWNQLMDEKEFWIALEFRLCDEFAGTAERHRRHWWCDGFVPVQYDISSGEPKITGEAWICQGQKQENWHFVLFLNKPYATS